MSENNENNEEVVADETAPDAGEETSEDESVPPGDEMEAGSNNGSEPQAEEVDASGAVEASSAAALTDIAQDESSLGTNREVLMNVPISLTVEVGRTQMTIGELLESGEGLVVKLNRLIDEPLDILVNNAPVARGLVVTSGDQFGIQITDIISTQERAVNLQQNQV